MKNIVHYFFGALSALILFVTIAVSTYFVLNQFQVTTPTNFLAGFNLVKLKNKLPKLFVVYSGSMEPAIKAASIVISYPQDSYYPGDIITFSSNNSEQLITHRIEYKNYPNGIENDPTYLTSGDANEDLDNWDVKSGNIVGKVVLTVPYLGYIANFAKSPYGFILLVIAPATIIVYEELKYLFVESKKHSKKIINRIFFSKSRKSQHFFNHNSKLIKGLPKISVLIPTFGAILVIAAFSSSHVFDSEKSMNNLLGAADVFQEEPESPTPTPVPDATATPTPIPPTPTPIEEPSQPTLVINEFLVTPSEGNDWVELYSNTDIDISNYILDDEGTSTDMATIPSGIIIGPSTNSFYLIEVSNRLNVGGDTIYFYNPSKEVLIDSHIYSSNPGTDISIGREIDASSTWITCNVASKGSTNNGLCGI
ncbi:signal peptidase I [Candidatus Woesebacteria bacterium RBG_16_34_12]|uniref:Signal peptidase I n=1 Tax=Candidatus Woesebacteria bacterium RBG_16_34_12 TaxID=1802480 RepID=A0A1F7XDD2_9BACT|nr:MAG: signal peptidase I [Candidatus Woesebacteria bacterium RBG_16_34_12]